jgi:hypothetical protein
MTVLGIRDEGFLSFCHSCSLRKRGGSLRKQNERSGKNSTTYVLRKDWAARGLTIIKSSCHCAQIAQILMLVSSVQWSLSTSELHCQTMDNMSVSDCQI